VVAPIVEEFLFRGVIQTVLVQRFWVRGGLASRYVPSALHRWVAIGGTSVLFAGMHSPDHFPVLFVLSLGLGYVYERTGNLWAAVSLHAIFNCVTLAAMLFSKSA